MSTAVGCGGRVVSVDLELRDLIVVVVAGSGITIAVLTTGVSKLTGIDGKMFNTPAKSLRTTAPTTLNVTSREPSASSSTPSIPA